MKTLICATTGEYRGTTILDTAPAGMVFGDLAAPEAFRPGESEAWLLRDGAWAAVADHRGEVWHDPATGAELQIDALDVSPPAGYVSGAAPVVSVTVTRDALLARLAAVRYIDEVAGTTLADGTRVLTGRDDQAMTLAAYTTLREGFRDSIDWKGPDGWVSVTLTALAPIARAMAAHVQRCFSAERAVAEQIAALTDAALSAFDVVAAFAAALGEAA